MIAGLFVGGIIATAAAEGGAPFVVAFVVLGAVFWVTFAVFATVQDMIRDAMKGVEAEDGRRPRTDD